MPGRGDQVDGRRQVVRVRRGGRDGRGRRGRRRRRGGRGGGRRRRWSWSAVFAFARAAAAAAAAACACGRGCRLSPAFARPAPRALAAACCRGEPRLRLGDQLRLPRGLLHLQLLNLALHRREQPLALRELRLDLRAALVELEDCLRLSHARALDGDLALGEHLALRLHLLDEAPVESRRRVNRLEAVEDVVEVRRAEDRVDRRRVLRLVERDEPRLGALLGDAVAVAGPAEEHLVVRLLLLDLRELVLRAVPRLDGAVGLVVERVAPARGSAAPGPPSASPVGGVGGAAALDATTASPTARAATATHHARKRRLLMSPISVSSPLRPPTLRAASTGSRLAIVSTVHELTGDDLTLSGVWDVAVDRAPAGLSARAVDQMQAAREVVQRVAHGASEHTYGVNTGFGRFVSKQIPEEQTEELQLRLLRSHACGVGVPYPDDVVRAAMLLRANALAKGNSGRAARDRRAAARVPEPRSPAARARARVGRGLGRPRAARAPRPAARRRGRGVRRG